MFEETNQTEEMLSDELFTEEAEEMTEGAEGAPEGELEAGVVAPGEKPSQDVIDFLRVKYNGEEKDLPLDEARVLAQKGMNYDKILGERDDMYRLIDQYAEASGVTREQFIQYLRSELLKYSDQSAIDKLRKSYPGASDDILRELAVRDKKISEAETKEREESERIERENAVRGPWINFFSRHPEIKPETLSPEFYKLVEDGMSPEEAFLTTKLNELEGKNAITQQNEDNLMRAVGSAKGDGQRMKADQFLDGFNGV